MNAARPHTDLAMRAVAALTDLEPGLPTSVLLPDGTRVCLVREGDEVHALADRCPHRDFAISGGDLVRPGVIECPWHGAQFDVRTGAVLQGPAETPLTVHRAWVANGTVFLLPATSDAVDA